MKSKKIIALMVATTLLLSGCSQLSVGSSSNKSTSSDKVDLASVSDQISTLQESLDTYTNTTSYNTNSEIIPEKDLNPSFIEANGNLIFTITNSSKNLYSGINTTIIFYDSSNTILSYSSVYTADVFPNTSHMLTFSLPMNSDYIPVAYDHYELQFKGAIAKSEMINYADKVEITSNIGANGNVIAKCSNHSDVTLGSVTAYIIFYQGDSVVGTSETYFNDLLPNAYALGEFSNAYNSSTTNYDSIPYDRYEVVVTSATVVPSSNGYTD